MPKIFYPGETPGRDGVNAPSPANPAIYPIGGRKGRLGLTPGKGGGVISTPSSDFSWFSEYGITLGRNGSAITHNYDKSRYLQTETVTYYWDPLNGADANTGTSWAQARKTLGGIRSLVNNIAVTGIAAVHFRNANVIQRRASTLIFTRNAMLISDDGSVPTTVMAISETPPTITKTASYTNVYEFASTSSTARMADVSAVQAGYPAYSKRYYRMEPVASIALVDSTPNSFFHDTGANKKYFHTFDNRAGDDNVIELSSAVGPGFVPPATVTNPYFWTDAMTFVGGGTGFSVSELTAAGGSGGNAANRVYLNGMTVQATSQDGHYFGGLGKVLRSKCSAFDTDVDGFSLWGLNAASNTDPTGTIVNLDCVADNCGRSAGGAQTNSDTAHSMGVAINVNCDFRNAFDRNIHYVNATKLWMLGGIAGPCRQATGVTSRALVAGNANSQTVVMYLDGVSVLPGSLYDLNTYLGCSLLFRSAIPPGLTTDPASAGTIGTYS